jgi:hypothetical protein
MEYNVMAAIGFFNTYINNITFNQVCIDKGFSVNGLVSSKCWEVFAAILVNESSNPSDSPDLTGGWEIKSALMGSSFEYQYHRNEGIRKLKDDISCKHLFISYDTNYQSAIVRTMNGSELTCFFDTWMPLLEAAYQDPKCQRFRKSVPYSYVSNNAQFVMKC